MLDIEQARSNIESVSSRSRIVSQRDDACCVKQARTHNVDTELSRRSWTEHALPSLAVRREHTSVAAQLRVLLREHASPSAARPMDSVHHRSAFRRGA